MVQSPVRGLQLSAIALAMMSAGFSAWAAADYAPRRAEVLRAEAGRPLADARQGTPAQAVAAVLRSRGRDAASLAALRQSEARNGRAGMKHLRFEQTVDGMPVYGAYAKAAFDRQGNLVQVIDRLARVPAEALKAPKVEPLQALRNAMARVHPGVSASFSLKSSGNGVAVFEGGAFFDEAPTVTSVVVPLSDGSMARGYLVETWSLAGNQLHHTLVSGDGAVLNVQKRSATDSYNVFTIDPSRSPQAVVSGPGTGNAESPAGWLDGTVDKSTNISGNNVNAYLDADANNRADAGGTRNRTGNFLTASSLGTAPTTTTNKAVAVQNLFYLNNVVHDILYRHGFDETAGNFQVDNFGKGGAGNDAVRAEAQDGGGTDNANFATPPDGRKPRMQMYLWTGAGFTHELALSSPSPVTYGAMGAQFGPALNTTGLTGSIATASPVDGCTALTGFPAGKVALMDRGTCAFTIKVANAQAAGAIGAVIANNTGGAFTMGGTDASLTIPAVMVTQNDGATLKTLASPAGTMRAKAVQPLQIDASLDSDIVFHEYGHGLSWRMIGDMGGKLSGAIGEGASDAVAMLINGEDKVARYSSSNPNGIRRFPYAGYPLTYANVDGGEVHNDGEIYAAIIWRLMEMFGPANRSKLMDYFVDGMNFTVSDPAYEDMREGILASVAAGPAPTDKCMVWSAFAQFGVGVGASGTVSPGGVVTVVPSFTVPAECAP